MGAVLGQRISPGGFCGAIDLVRVCVAARGRLLAICSTPRDAIGGGSGGRRRAAFGSPPRTWKKTSRLETGARALVGRGLYEL